jgi:hypothetical protein
LKIVLSCASLISLTLSLALFVACESPKPAITVENAWARPTIAASDGAGQEGMTHAGHGDMSMPHQGATTAVYFSLTNSGKAADGLRRAKSDVCEAVEIHLTKVENDRMMMAIVQEGVEVPAKGKVEFKPGGYHMMLIGVRKPLKVGDKFPLTLEFEKSGELTVEPEVRQP